jgi:nitrous oxidase accessory protein NosD
VNSDGLSFQIADDVTIEESVFEDCVQGIHAGSGSQRPVIRNNVIRRITSHGLAWCWGVKYGVAEGNVIEDCGSATSIGHRDTDNIMRGNTFRRCTTGLVYRDDPPHQAAHDNLVEDNLFEDLGSLDAPGYGIDMSGPVRGNILRRNRIVCTQPGLMKAAIRIGEKVESVEIADNTVAGIEVAVEDLRG